MRKLEKQHISLNLSILFCFLSIAFFGQSKPMGQNKNKSDFEFIANAELNAEFIAMENLEKKIQIIAKITNDSTISIYIKNNTKDTLEISKQDWQLYLIQEAKTKKGKWKPIEYWNYSTCGNSYSTKKIESQKIFKTETEKYNGKFETEIRFKFLINNETIYSNILKSKIDLKQFKITKKFTKQFIYCNVLKVSNNKELSEKVLFLEPNAMEEYSEKNDIWIKMIIEKNKKRRESENKQTE